MTVIFGDARSHARGRVSPRKPAGAPPKQHLRPPGGMHAAARADTGPRPMLRDRCRLRINRPADHLFSRLTAHIGGTSAELLGTGICVLALLAAVVRFLPGVGMLLLVATSVLLMLALTVVSGTSLALKLYAWRVPAGLDEVGYRSPGEPHLGFSLIVPARDEVAVLGRTVEALVRQDHPRFEILIVVSGDDDEPTRQVALRLEGAHHQVKIVMVRGERKNKPLALNEALPHCRYDIVGVIDAESIVAPSLLRHVDYRFRETEADTVISGVQLFNVNPSWWSLQNCLEYYFWFRSRLHYQAVHGFVPYSGNSIFIRSNWLFQLDGWDPDCLAEDCELGVRMSARGAVTTVAYDPALTTREETPGSLKALYHQRVRWMQGFLQTYRKGAWKSLPGHRQKLLARYTLMMPHMQAVAGAAAPLAIITAIMLKLPVGIALLTFLPLLPALTNLAVDMVAYCEFSRMYGQKSRWYYYPALAFGMFPYQFVLSAAALTAVYREYRGINDWYKTAHVGAHHGILEHGALVGTGR